MSEKREDGLAERTGDEACAAAPARTRFRPMTSRTFAGPALPAMPAASTRFGSPISQIAKRPSPLGLAAK